MRYWEQALTEALARLQAHGYLRPEADVTALGSAFAALLHGGLLLSQATGTSMPVQAALEMALGQIGALGASDGSGERRRRGPAEVRTSELCRWSTSSRRQR